MKRIIVLALIVALVLGSIACVPAAETNQVEADNASSAEAGAEEQKKASVEAVAGVESLPKITIAVAPPEVSEQFSIMEDYFNDVVDQGRKAGLDIEVIWKAPDEVVADQIAIIEDLCQTQPDVLLYGPVDADAQVASMQEVNALGIPLIVINQLSRIENVETVSYIGMNDFDSAVACAWPIVDALGGPGFLGEGEKVAVEPGTRLNGDWWAELYKDVDKSSISGKVAMIEGIAGSWNSNQRVDGFYSVMNQFPNIEIVARDASNWSQLTGMEITENYIQNFGADGLDAVWTAGGKPGLGAVQAAIDAGVSGDLVITTEDGTPTTIEAVIAGTLTADVWHGFADWGWYGALYAIRTALGLEVPEEYDPHPSSILAANASDYYPYTTFPTIDWDALIAEAVAAQG